MTHLTIKKENCKNWTSYKKHYTFKHKGLRYWLFMAFAKIKGYEVEILEDGEIN